MGLFGSAVAELKVNRERNAARGDIVGQAQVLYAETLEEVRATPREGLDQEFPELLAARKAEKKLLANVQLFEEQLRADGKRACLPEIRTAIIEMLYEIKVKALERDGFVSLFDKSRIASKAKALENKARAYFMNVRTTVPTGSMNDFLDIVEDRLLKDARKENGEYDAWMRATQAAILAAKTLRLQKLANIIPA